MSQTEVPTAPGNDEAISAWDGVLFERWMRYRHIFVAGLANHGDEALRLFPPHPGWRVLDVGCGLGDTTQAIARAVGPGGEAVGVDAAVRMIEIARTEMDEMRIANARFEVADVQLDPLGDGYHMAYSRMGTMFFANPVAALRNVRRALEPGAPLVMVVWRRREDNPWVWEAQQVVERLLGRPEEYDQPTCGPGPFSMASADTVSDQLLYAGFTAPTFRRCDLPILLGQGSARRSTSRWRSVPPRRSSGCGATGWPIATTRCARRPGRSSPALPARTGPSTRWPRPGSSARPTRARFRRPTAPRRRLPRSPARAGARRASRST